MSISPADLFRSADLTEEEACRFLQRFGFRDPAAADRQLQALAGELSVREALADLAGALLDTLSAAADPDAALSAFVHYAGTRSPVAGFLRYLAEDPRALGVLIDVGGSSTLLTDFLIANPESFHWLVREIDRSPPDVWELGEEADRLLSRASTAADRRDALRRFKERETLRIAAREMLGRDPFDGTIEQLSGLAEIVIGRSLSIARDAIGGAAPASGVPGRFTVLALGRLGAGEIDYGAGELIYVYDPDGERKAGEARTFFGVLGHMLTAVLTGDDGARPLQRVRHPRWFVGEETPVARSLASCSRDLELAGDVVARISLSTARPIAGDLDLGYQFLQLIEPATNGVVPDAPEFDDVLPRDDGSVLGRHRWFTSGATAVRRIEACTQLLQMTWATTHPQLRQENTLGTLASLTKAGILSPDASESLSAAYRFLRRIEHRMHLLYDPADGRPSADECARHLGLADGSTLQLQLATECQRVQQLLDALLERRPMA